MKRFLVSLLMCASFGYGQTLIKVFDSITTAQTSGVISNASTNQFHQITVRVTNPVGKTTCPNPNGWSGNIHIIASNDNVNYFQIGPPIQLVAFGSQQFYTAAGSFQYIKFQYSIDDGGNCALSAWYSGNHSGNPTSSAPFAAANDIFLRVPFSFTANATPTGISGCGIGQGGYISIYGLNITNNETTVNQVLQLIFRPSQFGSPFTFSYVMVPPGTTKSFISNERPLWSGSPTGAAGFSVNQVELDIAGTSTTEAISGDLLFRCE